VAGEIDRLTVRKGPEHEGSGGDESGGGRSWETGRALTFGRDVYVGPDERVEGDLVVLGGSVTVDGRVSGDVVTLGGDIEARGEISGNVVSVGGSVHLEPTTSCFGDVVSVGGTIETNGAEIGGDSVELSVFSDGGHPSARSALLAGLSMSFFGFLLVLLILGTFFPSSGETMLAVLVARARRCLGLGAVAAALTLFSTLLLTITVIGAPLALIVLAGAWLAAQVGRILAAAWIGRSVLGRLDVHVFKAGLVGGLVLHLAYAFAIALLVGPSALRSVGVGFLALVWVVDVGLALAGMGALVVTRWGRREGWMPVEPTSATAPSA
jgi:hypothetical protein